ncbi:MAG TPA: ribosome biogenesis GTPase YlqF [Epulopiscium sp.]|nr:ribosome biogenesis GTPase YlqF [Candidatus Epulonipiscium sp.]
MNIQWYPGHMTKTRKIIIENLKIIDVVIELVDARAPLSSKNPDIDVFAPNKPKIILLNKADLADKDITKKWADWYEKQGARVIEVNSITGGGVTKVIQVANDLMKERIAADLKRGRINRPIRAMIVGIPNVGKSTFINKLVGKASAKTGDRPGVTRGKQWVKVKKGFELLDTPGILWPKFEDKNVALDLAFIGSIKDDILDIVTLSYKLIERLQKLAPSALTNRYKIVIEPDDTSDMIFEKIARKRGFIISGGKTDELRTSQILLDEFRGGVLGKISIETPKQNR